MIWNERIKYLRESHDLTLKDVAKILGVSEATAQRYESNAIKNIPYEVIIKYAEIYQCTPCYIMGWEKESSITLSGIEEKIIKSYRTADNITREMVQRILGIDEKEKIENISSA